MKAITFSEFGETECLLLSDQEKPPMGAAQVLIKASYAGVNPVDWKIRKGYLSELFPHEFPVISGWDTVGVIEAVGENVTSLKVGERVYAYARKPVVKWGTYAEYVSVDAEHAAGAPAALSDAEAAGVPLVSLTAWQALFDFAELKRGQTVLIHAGAGGVGSIAIQLAKWKGAKVYTTGSAKKHEYLRSLGADVAIDYKNEDFVAALAEAEPGGVDVVFDLVGGEVQERSFEATKSGGVLVSIVSAPSEELQEKYRVGKAGFVFVEPSGETLSRLASLFNEGTLQASPVKTYPMEDAAQAHLDSESGRSTGKLVLRIR